MKGQRGVIGLISHGATGALRAVGLRRIRSSRPRAARFFLGSAQRVEGDLCPTALPWIAAAATVLVLGAVAALVTLRIPGIALATGVLLTDGPLHQVQSPQVDSVAELFVENGQPVQTGEPLLQLATGQLLLDRGRLVARRAALARDHARLSALIEARLPDVPRPISVSETPPDWSEGDAEASIVLDRLQSRWNEVTEASRAGIAAQLAVVAREKAETERQINLLDDRINNATLRAPADGVALFSDTLMAESGVRGMHILPSDADVRLVAVLPERAFADLAVDQTVTIHLDVEASAETIDLPARIVEARSSDRPDGFGRRQRSLILSLGSPMTLQDKTTLGILVDETEVRIAYGSQTLFDYLVQPMLHIFIRPDAYRKAGAA